MGSMWMKVWLIPWNLTFIYINISLCGEGKFGRVFWWYKFPSVLNEIYMLVVSTGRRSGVWPGSRILIPCCIPAACGEHHSWKLCINPAPTLPSSHATKAKRPRFRSGWGHIWNTQVNSSYFKNGSTCKSGPGLALWPQPPALSNPQRWPGPLPSGPPAANKPPRRKKGTMSNEEWRPTHGQQSRCSRLPRKSALTNSGWYKCPPSGSGYKWGHTASTDIPKVKGWSHRNDGPFFVT